jgi:hypothetical protein
MARRGRLSAKEFCVSMWMKMIKDDGKSEVRKGLTAKDHKKLKVFISVFAGYKQRFSRSRYGGVVQAEKAVAQE